MPKFMFIAEKPSLMRDVQACYRKHKDEIVQKVGQIDFIALAGHVCTNFEPGDYEEWKDKKWYEVDYPMVPKQWEVKPISDSYKLKSIQKIKELIGNYDGIIVGTDSDVEGYASLCQIDADDWKSRYEVLGSDLNNPYQCIFDLIEYYGTYTFSDSSYSRQYPHSLSDYSMELDLEYYQIAKERIEKHEI